MEGALRHLGHIIIISLPDRTHRLNATTTALNTANGAPTNPTVITPTIQTDPAGFTTPAARSCLLAHLDAATTHTGRFTVFEDDATPTCHWDRHGPEAVNLLASAGNWAIAQHGYLGPPIAGTEDTRHHATTSTGLWWYRYGGERTGSHAYTINADHQDRWVDHLTAISNGTPGDHNQGPMTPDGALNTYQWVHPRSVRLVTGHPLFGQSSHTSDINPRLADRLLLAGHVKRTLTRG